MWLPLTRRTARRSAAAADGLGHLGDPRAGGIDQRARGHGLALAARVRAPAATSCAARSARTQRVRVRIDGAALGGIDRVEHDEARVIDPAIGIFEAVAELALERLADHVMGEIDRLGAGQEFAPAEMVVEEQAEPQHPAPGAGPECAAARSASAGSGAAPCAAAPRARSAPRAPAGRRRVRDSAGRHGSAWSRPTRCRRPGRSARPAARAGRARRRRAQCRRR